MTKNCIVSLATKNGVYVDRLARLSNSLRDNLTDGDFLGFIHEASVGAPPHLDNPYSFKVHAINKCIEAGYKNILWLDTSMYAIKNVQPIFDEIEANGYFFHDSSHFLADWCNDSTLSYFGLTKKMIKGYTMVHGGIMGFNFENRVAKNIFKKLEKAMESGCFKGEWETHRHEMATMSCILFNRKNNIIIKPTDEVLQFAGENDPVINDTIIFKAQG